MSHGGHFSMVATHDDRGGDTELGLMYTPGVQDKLLNTNVTTIAVSANGEVLPMLSGGNLPEGHALIDARPYEWSIPEQRPPYKPHQGEGSQYLRDFILGINDGLISTLLLVVGMVGGGSDCRAILLAAISGAIAGSIAMGLGEYIATKSQNEVVKGEMQLEQEHFKYHRDQEISQLRAYLADMGLDGPLLEACVRKIGSNDEHLMTMMLKFEFGAEASEDLERSPLKAMFMSGRLFFIGALPSTLPFLQNSPNLGMLLSCVLCGFALFGVGVYKTRTTGGIPWRGGFENFMAGALGAGLSYVVGLAYNAIRNA